MKAFPFFLVIVLLILYRIYLSISKKYKIQKRKKEFYERLKKEQQYCLNYLEAIYLFAKKFNDPFSIIYFSVLYKEDYGGGDVDNYCRAVLSGGIHDSFEEAPIVLSENPPLKDIINYNLPGAEKPVKKWFDYQPNGFGGEELRCFEFPVCIKHMEKFFPSLGIFIKKAHPEWDVTATEASVSRNEIIRTRLKSGKIGFFCVVAFDIPRIIKSFRLKKSQFYRFQGSENFRIS